ncbi:phospholipid hydroperoxide glutathione peroxidase isoform X1 [Wolffia australiana]
MPDTDKMQLLSLHLDDEAQDWFEYAELEFGMRTWEEFKEHFSSRYSICSRRLYKSLFEIQQTGFVTEYRAIFERLIVQIPHLQRDVKENAYLRGLKPKICREVLKARPYGLKEIMDLSLQAEIDLGILYTAWQNNPCYPTSPNPDIKGKRPAHEPSHEYIQQCAPHHSMASTSRQQLASSQQASDRNGRRRNPRLTEKEFQQRKDKGLCFYCNERLASGHRCKRNLNLIMVLEGDQESLTTEDEVDYMQTDETPINTGSLFTAQIAFHFSESASPNGLVKLWGSIKGVRVRILIDGGATHNFINSELVTTLYLTVFQGPPFDILLANGVLQQSAGICLNVPIYMQGLQVIQDLIPIPMPNMDIILGVQWLKTLEWFYSNYKLLNLKILWNGKVHTLSTDRNLLPRGVPANLSVQEFIRSKRQF